MSNSATDATQAQTAPYAFQLNARRLGLVHYRTCLVSDTPFSQCIYASSSTSSVSQRRSLSRVISNQLWLRPGRKMSGVTGPTFIVHHMCNSQHCQLQHSKKSFKMSAFEASSNSFSYRIVQSGLRESP